METNDLQICALCLQPAELIKSHLMPAAIYRSLRSPDRKNPNPTFLSESFEGTTSRQVRQPLLCRSCENLFHSNGEDWTLRNTPQTDGSFPFLSRVRATEPVYADGTTQLYVEVGGASHLVYFAASVFWRAGATQWRTPDGENIGIDLGPYQKQLGEFLLGRSTFPQEACMGIRLLTHSALRGLFRLPSASRVGIFKSHDFQVPGIQFCLFFGKPIPESFRNLCAIRSGSILVVPNTEDAILKRCTKTRWAAASNRR